MTITGNNSITLTIPQLPSHIHPILFDPSADAGEIHSMWGKNPNTDPLWGEFGNANSGFGGNNTAATGGN